MSIPNVNDTPYLISVSDDLKYAENNRTYILQKVFALLVEMIQTLQKTAATQSDRLQIYTSWQKAYTSQMNEIPAFTASNSAFHSSIIGTGTDPTNARDDLNKLNVAFTEQIRGRSGVVSDDAKALQTSVNQTSDAVNQQTNMATSLLEQLSTILGSIFR